MKSSIKKHCRLYVARKEWIKIFERTKSVTITSRRSGVPRSTIYRWINRFQKEGESGLKSRSRKPHRLAKKKVTKSDEEMILELRDKHKWGSQRISTYLQRNQGPELSDTTIWRVLKKYNVKPIKKYRRTTDCKRYSRPIPGDRVQIDVTKIKSKIYQYTAIDDCTRLKVLRLYPDKNAQNSIHFLMEMIDAFSEIGFTIQRIQSDCGSEFYNETFQQELLDHYIKFRPNPPGSPHLNGKVERSQKTDKEEFYRLLNFKDQKMNLKKSLKEWERFYNYKRYHSALSGKTPYERFLELSDHIPDQFEVFDLFRKSNENIKSLEWEKYKKKNPDIAKIHKQILSQMS